MFSLKPDYQQAQTRINAFWSHGEVDRPAIIMSHRKPAAPPYPHKTYPTHQSRWLDSEERAKETLHWMENTVFHAEAMPVCMPDLGPSLLSGMAGCPYTFEATTSWTKPCMHTWENDTAIMDMNHPLGQKLKEYTKALLEVAKGKFIVGLSDLHPGGDHLAALRGSENLAMDLLEYPDEVKAKLESSYKEYFPIYDYYVNWLKKEGNPIASWIPLTSEKDMYIPSNDFSYMISKPMFDEFFLPGIVEECRHYSNSIYHLDGPGSILHLDSLLAIPELDAIQWVPGAAEEQVRPWIDLFKKILAAKKSIIAYPQNMMDLKLLMENLPAQGLCLQMWGIQNQEEADDLMKLIGKWGR